MVENLTDIFALLNGTSFLETQGFEALQLMVDRYLFNMSTEMPSNITKREISNRVLDSYYLNKVVWLLLLFLVERQFVWILSSFNDYVTNTADFRYPELEEECKLFIREQYYFPQRIHVTSVPTAEYISFISSKILFNCNTVKIQCSVL